MHLGPLGIVSTGKNNKCKFTFGKLNFQVGATITSIFFKETNLYFSLI